ncbi:DMT family transporter [Devosia sp. XGJD_8]|uniref:DMT family transporter n=1 Tax=Devosia sp. XGJD_8 TaxID=3391187 RepID=UPI00398550B9
MRTILLTAVAMVAFAANSILARLALGSGAIDAASYTGIRLASGAVVLGMLVMLRGKSGWRSLARLGTWQQAAALLGYALAFSLAYQLLGASVGALILFASVQTGMVARAVLVGDRPGALEWLGLGLAGAAFVYLVSPGLASPDPLGALLMVVSGLCWAAYSLLGRGSSQPLADTAGNFLRCLPFAVLLLVGGLALNAPRLDGVFYAVASGAIASGLGYAIWYAALPELSRTRAAVVQLSVPVIAAFGAALFIGETVTPRLLVSSALILGGIALATLLAGRRSR